MTHPSTDTDTELDRQTDVLVGLGYPTLAALSESDFRDLVEPLREPLRTAVADDPAPTAGHAPFVVVVNRTLVPVSARVELVTLNGRPGVLNRHFADVDTFAPILDVPDAPVYAVLDLERGEEFCGVRPADAAVTIVERGRTPITMDEGLGLLHASPASLEKNKCFHTAASRGTDKRVPALWISKNAPTLGWCWEHNHHTWLGVASAGGRLTG
jgi:hypothetical protein